MYTRTFNFQFTASVDNYSFSPRDLCAMLGLADVGAISTDVYPAFAWVRVHKIELWGGNAPTPGATTLSGVQAWITRTLTDGNPTRILGNVRQDLHVPGSSIPSHVVLTPKQKPNSILRQNFEQDDHDYLFAVTAGQGTLMQITVTGPLHTFGQNTSNIVTTTSYLSALGRPVLGLSALDSGNPSGSRIVTPVPIGASLTNQIPIFD